MAAQYKTERLMNLVIALLVTRQYLPKSRIREVVSGYEGQSAEAFDRMFERDKRELRELGIQLETGSCGPFFDGEEGYRIVRDEVELPDLDLTVQEAGLLSVAAQVWDHLGLARQSTSAVAKLKAAGVAVDDEAFTFTEPVLSPGDAAFDDVWDAVTQHRPIRFEYRRPRAEPAIRHLQPWAVLSWHGSWYVIGHDTDREDTRVFRLNRITGPVERTGAGGSYQIREGLDVQSLAEHIFTGNPSYRAHVLARTGKAVGLRRIAETCEPAGGGMDRLIIPYWDDDLMAAQIAALGEDAYVEAPTDVRELVIRRLRAGVGQR